MMYWKNQCIRSGASAFGSLLGQVLHRSCNPIGLCIAYNLCVNSPKPPRTAPLVANADGDDVRVIHFT